MPQATACQHAVKARGGTLPRCATILRAACQICARRCAGRAAQCSRCTTTESLHGRAVARRAGAGRPPAHARATGWHWRRCWRWVSCSTRTRGRAGPHAVPDAHRQRRSRLGALSGAAAPSRCEYRCGSRQSQKALRPGERAPDRELVDGLGALVGDDALQVQQVADRGELGADAGAAEQVAAVARDIQGHAAVVPLGQRHLRRLHGPGVLQTAELQRQQLRGGDAAGHVGQADLHALGGGQRPTEEMRVAV